MLIGIVAFFLSFFWNHNQFNNYMVQRLYKMEKKDNGRKVKDYDDRSNYMSPGIISNQRDAICDRLPSFCQCLRNNRLDKSFELGRTKLEKETNIIDLIKERRYFYASLKLLLTRRQRERLKQRTRFLLLNPNSKKSKNNDSESDFATTELQSDPEERFFYQQNASEQFIGGGLPVVQHKVSENLVGVDTLTNSKKDEQEKEDLKTMKASKYKQQSQKVTFESIDATNVMDETINNPILEQTASKNYKEFDSEKA